MAKAEKEEQTKTKKKNLSSEELDQIITDVGISLKTKPISLYRGNYIANTFSSGSLSLDLILGGGYGIGRWVSIFGPSASGKSSLIYTAMAILQRLNCPQIVFDHEGSIDPVYMKSIGVSLHKKRGFYYLPSDVGELTFRFMRRFLKQLPDLDDEQRKNLSRPRAVFFLDSIAAMIAQAMDENDSANTQAQLAIMLSKMIPRVKNLLAIKGCTVIATNQIREAPMSFGNPEREPGGNAPAFYPDCRIRIAKHSAPKAGAGEQQGSFSFKEEESLYKGGGVDRFVYTKARTVKNRMFSPFLDTELRINLGRGLDPIQDAVSYLEMTGQLVGSGGNYTISLDGEEKVKAHGWLALGRIVCTPEFRRKCREQMQSNKAFKMFFEVQSGRAIDQVEEKGEDPLAIYSLADEEEVSTQKKSEEKGKRFVSTGKMIKELRKKSA